MCTENNKKLILLGICGGIASYKSLEIIRKLIKNDFDVQVIMTQNAIKFVAPLTFSTISGCNVITDIFSSEGKINHIEITKKADLFLYAPATANLLGKLAAGIADDALTTMSLASTCPKVIAPAMNVNMWKNSIVQKNLDVLIKFGFEVIYPQEGELACKEVAIGRMEEPDNIVSFCINLLSTQKKFINKTILITAGRTEEMIDPVRYISNRSSGRMGYALAKQAKLMGAKVILISGAASIPNPFVDIFISVKSADEMRSVVLKHFKEADIIIKAAAVSDYKIENISLNKIKKTQDKISVNLIKNPDILSELGNIIESSQYLAGFAAETENLIEEATRKLKEKKLDLIIANDVSQKGTGFESENNKVVLIDKKYEKIELPILSKNKTAIEILNKIALDLGNDNVLTK